MSAEWKVPSSQELVRPRPLRRLSDPLRERNFTYAAYERFLDRLTDPRFRVVPLREFRSAPRDRALVGLRHDVDERLDSALRLAEAERERGLRATYFVLHTARYYREPGLLDRLRRLQDLGHEVGWHNDLVTLECIHGGDARRFLQDELARLRDAGLRITGVVSHGSVHCGRYGYHNDYFFEHCEREIPGYPNKDVVPSRQGARPVPKATLAEFGLEYDGSYLDDDAFFHDSFFDSHGRRWHTDELDPESLPPGAKAIVLVHPCHWDASTTAKVRRLARVAGARLTGEKPV